MKNILNINVGDKFFDKSFGVTFTIDSCYFSVTDKVTIYQTTWSDGTNFELYNSDFYHLDVVKITDDKHLLELLLKF